jgi:hypothetical protein
MHLPLVLLLQQVAVGAVKKVVLLGPQAVLVVAVHTIVMAALGH